MFGYVTANLKALNDAQLKRYRAWYCGLCSALRDRCGAAGRFTLTYDMTFLAMLLASALEPNVTLGSERCGPHPLKKHDCLRCAAIDYAADMNLLLLKGKLEDDWRDDKKRASKAALRLLSKSCDEAAARYPEKNAAAERCYAELLKIEQSGEPLPDEAAKVFGALTAELFDYGSDEWLRSKLRAFGDALGRFIYVMDAAVDLDDDLKHERYNPLAYTRDTDALLGILQLLAADCAAEFEKLPLVADSDIMKNIIYSGIWLRWNARYGKKEGSK